MIRIVVLGSGFAGTYATRQLDRLFRHDNEVEITLISRNNYMVFTPLLPEVAGNVVEPTHAVPPVRNFLKKARFQQGEVREIDLNAQKIKLEYPDGRFWEESYDYLVIALGSVTNFRHAPGAAAQSFDLKSLDDAIRLRNHVLSMLEQADVTDDPETRREMLTFVAAGGGYAGVEGLGLLIDFVDKALRFYPSIKPKELKFMLVSHGDRLLDQIDDTLGSYVVHKLRERGVEVRLGASVKAVTEQTAVLDSGETIPARTVLWAAGIAVNPMLKRVDLPKDKHGAIQVNNYLQVIGYSNIFALGDCAAVPAKNGTFYAPTAQNAEREGKVAAKNLAAILHGGTKKPFNYQPFASLASIGHYEAVAQIWGMPFSGPIAWFSWRTVYLTKLPDMSRRIRVALDWLLQMLLPTDTVQLPILPSDDMPQVEPNESAREIHPVGHILTQQANDGQTVPARNEQAPSASSTVPH